MTWEQRWHPLRREWVVVAAHRQARPWSGETVSDASPVREPYRANCYLCPGNSRVGGVTNPDYSGVFVFDNDHPPVGAQAPEPEPTDSPLLRARRADGLARVVCYSPRHDLSLAELDESKLVELFVAWQAQYEELAARPEVNHVLVFENKGEVVGVSNPHPHCQIYATNFLFKVTEIEIEAEREYFASEGRVLFQDIMKAELDDGRRILRQAPSALSFVPYFARYAYEVLIAPRKSHASMQTLSRAELVDLARVTRQTLVLLDNLWQMPFPYVLTLHQAPTDGGDYGMHHFYIQVLPPLRKPNLLKYLAGPELGGGCFISDTSPEAKAAELRALPKEHYLGGAP